MGPLIPDGSRVLLDTMVLVYFLEHEGISVWLFDEA